MCNYLSRFIPKLSQTSEPLRSLTENSTDFWWGTTQQMAFDKVKELVSEDQLLAFYDVTKPVVIQCDACQWRRSRGNFAARRATSHIGIQITFKG